MDFLLNILSHWESALAVLLVLGGLIFFHELGHFAVARLFRIGVRTFSLGFGPKLLKLRRGKTDYCLSLIPLGGYVALAGEEDEAEQPDPKGKEIDGVLFAPEELYSGRPAWHRLLVVLAGPVANFVLALIIYCGIAWAQGQTYLLPEVGDVTPGTPAATAGILPGDLVVVHRQQDAYNGEIVVALFEDEATVKTLSRRGGHTWLLPENPDYDPIDGDLADIIGRVVAVVRRY